MDKIIRTYDLKTANLKSKDSVGVSPRGGSIHDNMNFITQRYQINSCLLYTHVSLSENMIVINHSNYHIKTQIIIIFKV